MVDFPKRVIHNLSTAIDNIFVDNYRVNSFKISSIVNGLSDHDAQYPILKNVYIKSNITPMKYRTRLINNNTIKTFQQLLKYETWESVYLNNDVNDTFNTFFKIFLNIFQASFPIKYTNFDINKRDWISK
jgi:hypothetical protein